MNLLVRNVIEREIEKEKVEMKPSLILWGVDMLQGIFFPYFTKKKCVLNMIKMKMFHQFYNKPMKWLQ